MSVGVYIKSMEIPKDCGDCECGSIFAGYKCMINNRAFEKYPLTHRQDWCPLIEVPEPHGRLIEADEPISLVDTRGEQVEVTVAHIIEKNRGIVKVIIPASEEE